jgi:hypothetical protein
MPSHPPAPACSSGVLRFTPAHPSSLRMTPESEALWNTPYASRSANCTLTSREHPASSIVTP